ncbi:hypothetical protein BDQ17DRAFT_538689 [Cyathus striatus]|nr:hypothetical protein BDQ17DRAFT_538689 [Cyathus striatus]
MITENPLDIFSGIEDIDVGSNNLLEKEKYRKGKCAPETRQQILDKINSWVNIRDTSPFWLLGPTGTGKSTIASSFLGDSVSEKGAASFFFFNRNGESTPSFSEPASKNLRKPSRLGGSNRPRTKVNISGGTFNEVGRDQSNNFNIYMDSGSDNTEVLQPIIKSVKEAIFSASSDIIGQLKDSVGDVLSSAVNTVAGAISTEQAPDASQNMNGVTGIIEEFAPDTTKYPPLTGHGIQTLMSKTLVVVGGMIKSIVSIRYSFDFPDCYEAPGCLPGLVG